MTRPTKALLAKKNNPSDKINTYRMTTPNRTALLTKIHKVLKKHYKPVLAPKDPPVLESLLLASCLENTRSGHRRHRARGAEENVLRLERNPRQHGQGIVRGHAAPVAPADAAARLKGILQSVFESEYAFDLESLKKQNLGVAIKRLQKLDGATPFVVAYTVQTALAGHSIPVDKGSLSASCTSSVRSPKPSNAPAIRQAWNAPFPKAKARNSAACSTS